MKRVLPALAALACATALAQHTHQPYAGQQDREIKALSPDEVGQYLSGAGAGFAKPAELNRHPGPAHVLELADRLDLTPQQRERTQRLMDSHRAEARAAGAKVVEAERALEALFRRGDVGEAELAAAVRDAARLQGEYRLLHLETHRRMRSLLTAHQVARYEELRGYGAGHQGHRH